MKIASSCRKFDTGAVRDIGEHKGRCDLMPLDICADLLFIRQPENSSSDINLNVQRFIKSLNKYVHFGYHKKDILDTILSFYECTAISPFDAFLRVSKRFELGNEKYGKDNWKKGIPIHSYLDSALRHFMEIFIPDSPEEDHAGACLWNLICMYWTAEMLPDMIDIGTYHQPNRTNTDYTNMTYPNEISSILNPANNVTLYSTNDGIGIAY